jgi:hypothetical protein
MTRLSNLQYPMLETFSTGLYMSIESAQHFDQRPFRSMLIRQWITYRPGRGFHITTQGRKAHAEFHHTEIARKNPTLPLTSYFDPTAFGLRVATSSKRPAKKVAAAASTVREFRRGAA